MTATPRNPHPEAGAPLVKLDLEAEIVLAERAVIERDRRIRRRVDDIVVRTKQGVVRHAGTSAVVALTSLLGIGAGWYYKHRHPAPPAPPAPPPSEREHLAREAGLSIASLLPLIWPWMPHSVRRTVTPRMASSVLAFLSPFFGKLFRRRRPRVA